MPDDRLFRPRTAAPSARHATGWHREAVIYQAHVRAFFDSNGDGIGDFPGLTSRLDHIADLGATAVWLLPFYPSPLRDDGYDIADYKAVNPVYGTLDDFRAFVAAAHARGLRVIIELVVNHTSDQHPWFQRARRAPPGSPERDFYVWSDTGQELAEARIHFPEAETSNWAWDPVARAYYWHRFFAHQPDLNFDNARVLEEVEGVLHFWMDQGVDGFRLDAVPYLVEREGTDGEDLPETHAVLRRIRAEVERRNPDCVLLAEANLPPERTLAYFGRGDECHMAFHFPLMPRLFMAVSREDASPVVDVVERTKDLPEGCQWALFLRNHDELALSMLTAEERDHLWDHYAAHRRLRLNLGIRRRLASLLNGDRRRIDLMNGLLLSLPGTPVIYYGDEIGMGDNPFLGDRDGVRTPMQWSSDRNAGFSQADPVALYLPPVVRSAVRLPGGERGAAAPDALLAAELDALGTAGARCAWRRLRPGGGRVPARREQADARLQPHPRPADHPVRRQPVGDGAGDRARPFRLGGVRPDRPVRRLPLSSDRARAVPGAAHGPRLLLAGAGAGGASARVAGSVFRGRAPA